MKPDALLAWMRRHPEPDPPPACTICDGASGHPPLDGDGALVCLPCIYLIGRIVNEPGHTPVSVVASWWEDHKDVVQLRSCREHTICWEWHGWTSERDALADPDGAEMAVGQALIVARRAEMAGGRPL